MNFIKVIKTFSRWIFRVLRLLVVIGLLTLLIPRLITAIHAMMRIYDPETVPDQGVAIVFGAGLRWDGTPTPVLRDRVAAAAELYFSGKVKRLLFSGDNRYTDYNEPGSMRTYAISLGVPENVIILDYAGRRTYDTCYRALAIFGVSKAILVTQGFHLPRALYTCHMLGLDVVGVSADLRQYGRFSRLVWNVRELFASLTALWDVHVAHPLPVLGKPEPIHVE
jgi:vancomycin permeability regulator SanA